MVVETDAKDFFKYKQSKPVGRGEPVRCPYCEYVDPGAEGYEQVTRCQHCGMLYLIVRK